MKKILCMCMVVMCILSMVFIAPEESNAGQTAISEGSRTIMEKEQFRLYLKNCTSKVVWDSKNKSVAKVSKDGIVTGVKVGTTWVSAKVGKQTFQCKVKVIPAMSNDLTMLSKCFSSHFSPNYVKNSEKIRLNSISRGQYVLGEMGNDWNANDFDYKLVYSGELNNGNSITGVLFYNSLRGVGWDFTEVPNNPSQDRTDKIYGDSDVKKVEKMARMIQSGAYDPEADDGKIKMNVTDMTLCVGETWNLKVLNTTQSVKWTSSKKAVATVSKGKVTAKKTGKVTITAMVDGKRLSSTLYVIKKYPKNLRDTISLFGSVLPGFLYPNDFSITGIQLGTFSRNHMNEHESIISDESSEYFAIVSIKGKNIHGELSESDWGLWYNPAGECMGGPLYTENASPLGSVKKCTDLEIKEINALIHSGRARLLCWK